MTTDVAPTYETLYHYCRTEAFVSIISNRSIWLSSLTQSNDSKEGAIILDILLRLAKDSKLSSFALQQFEDTLRSAYDFFQGFGFCLSEKGDLLSQWRGYADDGQGFAIGFDRSYFEFLANARKERNVQSFGMTKLIYDSDGQIAIARKHFSRLQQFIDEGAFDSPLGTLLNTEEENQERFKKITSANMSARLALLPAMLQMFEIKHLAFEEEREWRLVSFIFDEFANGVRFRPAKNKIVPYLELPLEELNVEAIREVILGPKQSSPPKVVEELLKTYGFKNISVRRSSATYR